MTDSEIYLSQFYVKANGTDLAEASMNLLQEIVVEDDLSQPAMVTLRFHDQLFDLIDGTTFKPGVEIEIGAEDSKGTQSVLIKAEVVSLETDFDQHSTQFIVRGYDKSHRLYRGRATKTFLDKTDSAIASTVISEAGLSADVKATTVTHPYVIQDNQSPMDFLRARAARIGYHVYFGNNKVKFRPADETPPAAPALIWGKSLLSFRARLSSVGQPSSVEVRGWDPSTKKAIVGTASTATDPNKVDDKKTGPKVADTAFTASKKLTIVNQPVGTQKEATDMAQSVLDEMAVDFVEAEGVCLGEPKLLAGKTVEIQEMGTRFAGKYFVTSTRHVYTAAGYFTTFYVSGKKPNAIIEAVDQPAHHLTNGVVVGLVTNNNDDKKLGRVKVKFPWLSDLEESFWARLATPGAGKERGIYWLPEVDDEVLIGFEHGDINRPYVLGGLWNGKDAAAEATVQANGAVNLRVMKSRLGHYIKISDDSAKKFIEIKTAGGHTITMSDTDKKIEIKSNAHTVLLDDTARKITITSGGELEMTGAQSKLVFKTGGTLELSNPGGKLVIAPAGVNLEATASLTAKANINATFEGMAMATVKAGAIMTVQGALVKIN